MQIDYCDTFFFFLSSVHHCRLHTCLLLPLNCSAHPRCLNLIRRLEDRCMPLNVIKKVALKSYLNWPIVCPACPAISFVSPLCIPCLSSCCICHLSPLHFKGDRIVPGLIPAVVCLACRHKHRHTSAGAKMLKSMEHSQITFNTALPTKPDFTCRSGTSRQNKH